MCYFEKLHFKLKYNNIKNFLATRKIPRLQPFGKKLLCKKIIEDTQFEDYYILNSMWVLK